jgi:hypothetical protein
VFDPKPAIEVVGFDEKMKVSGNEKVFGSIKLQNGSNLTRDLLAVCLLAKQENEK